MLETKFYKLFIFSLLMFGYLNLSSQTSNEDKQIKTTLSDSELADFKELATITVESLGQYIGIIVDKKNNLTRRRSNIALALELFKSDSVQVEISSLTNRNNKTFKYINKYLTDLMNLRYRSVEITWANIYVSQNPVLGKDGRYYGTASFCQQFNAKTLRSLEKIEFDKTDYTCKSVQLVLELKEENNKRKWILKLGDISVDEKEGL